MSSPNGDAITELVALVEADAGSMLQLGKHLFTGRGSHFFPLDFLALAAIKRNLSIGTSIATMVNAKNMVSARALLRIHIDTALRFSAAWLVQEPHEFASKVMAGTRIDKLKGSDGKFLTDAHLVKKRSGDHPWLPDVYESLSGYVHFSASHVFDTIHSLEGNAISWEIARTDDKFPDSSWIEILECTREANGMLAKYVYGYAVTKRLSPEQLEALKNVAA
jgi:hypothetical protein